MVNSRRKGKAGELEAAAVLRRVLGVEARRGRQFAGSPDSPDIVTSIDSLHIEVKRTERLNLYAAMDQAEKDAGGRVAAVMHRSSRRRWTIVTYVEDLPRLVSVVTAGMNPMRAKLMSEACWQVSCLSPEDGGRLLVLRRGLTWDEAVEFFTERCGKLPQLEFILGIDRAAIAKMVQQSETEQTPETEGETRDGE